MTRVHTELTVYGTGWCPDVRRARRYLDRNDVPYVFVDIDEDAEARTYCDEVHGGSWIVPTIAFPDGDILCNPSLRELQAKVEATGKPDES